MDAGRARQFGTLLRRHRKSAHLTQEELAERAGISARAISDLERGVNQSPRTDTLQYLADALGLQGPARAEFYECASGAGLPMVDWSPRDPSRREEEVPDPPSALPHSNYGPRQPLEEGESELTLIVDAEGRSGTTPAGDLKYSRRVNYETVEYTDRVEITPEVGYISAAISGRPVPGIPFKDDAFVWSFPNLDVKLVNNSGKTVMFSRALFKVDESLPDPEPVIVVAAGKKSHPCRFVMINQGWGWARNCSVKFNLLPRSDESYKDIEDNLRFDQPFVYDINIPDFARGMWVDISDALRKECVELELLPHDSETKAVSQERLKDALGKFLDGIALVYGEFRYTSQAITGEDIQHLIRFYTTVRLIYGPYFDREALLIGAVPKSSAQYDLALEVQGQNYERRVDTRHVLKEGEYDRFNIRVGASQSSTHRFSIELMYDDGKVLASRPITLRILVPQSNP